MYLVKDRRFGLDNYVFTYQDPRADGYIGDVIENVSLDYDMNAVHEWPNGHPSPDPQLGCDPKSFKDFKVFKSLSELEDSRFDFVHSGTPFVVYSWNEYRKHYYPAPEDYAKSMTQDEWFDLLEEADAAAKLRRKLEKPDEPKNGSDRKQVAEWIARRHMGADGTILQVWFLRKGSPSNEIRLLEVSERFAGQPERIDPVHFGVDIAGAKYKLLVADVSTDVVEMIKKDSSNLLPENWAIDDALIWGRRELRK